MWNECKIEEDRIIENRRALHKIPEVGHNLPKTLGYIGRELEAYGVPYKTSKTDGSIIAELVGNPDGKVLVLRADVDALPMAEANEIPYKSIHEGCMHACGHDAHGAMMLGAIKVLKDNMDKINGTVRFLFQTAEEIAQGAEIMIADGAMDGADGVFGLHIGSIFGKDIPAGTVIASGGDCMASMDKFQVTIKGIGCHGSTPEKGVDPINIAAHIVISLQAVIAREFSATKSVVLTIGKISGGDTFNIIPNEVVLEGTIRALNQVDRETLMRRIEEISAQVAITFGGEAVTQPTWGAGPVVNDYAMAKLAADASAKVVGEEWVMRQLDVPNMGGEDFSYYLQKAPGAFLILSSANANCQSDIPHHNPKFQIDESVLWKGSAVFVSIVEEFLGKVN